MMRLPWRDQVPRPGGPTISTSITRAEAEELARLAPDRRVLEIGTAYGYSTVVMAMAGAVQVVTLDHHEWLDSAMDLRDNLAAYGVTDRVVVVTASSYEMLPRLAARPDRFDLVFLDGDHEDEAVAHDALWSRKLLAPGGILVCHDYGEDTCPGVKAALHRTVGFPDRLVDTLAIYEGLA